MIWFAFAAAWLARLRDRLVPVWAIYGVLLGPVALILLWAAPHGHCRTCHMPTQGWVTTCPWCHEDVNTLPSTARRTTQRAEPGASTVRQPLTSARSAAAPPTTPIAPTSLPSDAVSAPSGVSVPQTTGDRDAAGPTARRPFVLPQAPRPNLPASTDGIAASPRTRAARGDGIPSGQETRVLATATYVTGTARLEPGRRYGIAIRGSRFLIVGPVDLDSKRIALDRPVAHIQVSSLEGRLVVNEQAESGVVLAFMSAAGAGLDDLAGAIRSAARNGAP